MRECPACSAATDPCGAVTAAAAGAKAESELVFPVSQSVAVCWEHARPQCSLPGGQRPCRCAGGAAVHASDRDSPGEMSRPHHGDSKKSTAIDRHSHVCLHSWSLGVRTVRCLLPELECKHQFFRGRGGG